MSDLQTSNQQNAEVIAELSKKGWLSLNQFAKLVGVAYPTAMRMMKRGDIQVIDVGAVHRVYIDEIRRFLKEGNAKGEGVKLSPTTSS